MRPRPAFLLSLAAAVLPVEAAADATPPEKPNVIQIISDDHGFTDYGFMGHEIVRTPQLDRIAGESLLYTRGCTMPVCSPTLACLLTGKMPGAHGITGYDLSDGRSKRGQREALRERLLGNSLMLPKAVTEAGYLTFQTGKIWNATYEQVGFTHGIADLADPSKSRIADVVIDGWWKLIVPGPATPDRPFANVPKTPALFDLKSDPLEQNEVAGKHPEEVARLKALLDQARQ